MGLRGPKFGLQMDAENYTSISDNVSKCILTVLFKANRSKQGAQNGNMKGMQHFDNRAST